MRKSSLLAAFVLILPGMSRLASAQPNIIILFADDLGYGDLGCYGHPTIRTPNLDRMADEGMRFTEFYSVACVCTPSRAALMTGRYPVRTGMAGVQRRVLFPDSTDGLPASEITLAEVLKERGYATCCIGKWHLGHLPQFLPTKNGFDRYFGIPYSNDMKPCPLLDMETVIEEPADQTTLTARYTQRAVDFIRENRDRPFFLYLPYTFPHVPLFASEKFKGTSPRGLYGDVVEELDWSVGQILEEIRYLNLHTKTFVFFTSDNGPWLVKELHGGSAGLLHGGKGSTFEGGMREPGIAWWPGTIPANATTRELACTMDLYTTAITLAGAKLPDDRIVDGVDISAILRDAAPSPRENLFYYRSTTLYAVRVGPWKAHFITQYGYGPEGREPVHHNPPRLHNLHHDPSERFDVAKNHPDVIAMINKVVADHQANLDPPPNHLDAVIEKEK
jgi:arylsulfatase A-like enzyme